MYVEEGVFAEMALEMTEVTNIKQLCWLFFVSFKRVSVGVGLGRESLVFER